MIELALLNEFVLIKKMHQKSVIFVNFDFS